MKNYSARTYGQTESTAAVLADVAKSNNCAFGIITNLNCIISDSGSKLHYIVSG